MRRLVDEGVAMGEVTPSAGQDIHEHIDKVLQEHGEGDHAEATQKVDELRDRLRELQRDGEIETRRYAELRRAADDLRREVRASGE